MKIIYIHLLEVSMLLDPSSEKFLAKIMEFFQKNYLKKLRSNKWVYELTYKNTNGVCLTVY